MTGRRVPDAAVALAAVGLPTAPEIALPAEPLGGDAWARLLRAAGFERLSGFLVHAIATGTLPANDEQTAQAVELHVTQSCHALRLERRLLEVCDALTRVGVQVRVLKGPAIAHRIYPDPGLRLFGDVDLLVRGEQYASAVRVLKALGATRPLPPLREDFERRFGKGATFACEDGLEVDLHRLLVPGYFGLQIDADVLFRSRAPLQLGDRTLWTLDADLHLLHACYHAGVGHMARLQSLRDIVELALSDAADVERVLRLARSWDGRPVVARAVRLAWDRLGITAPSPLIDWARDYSVPPADRRRMAAYRGARAREASRGLDALAVIPGVRARAAFLFALAFPDRKYLDAVGTSRRQWLLRGVSSLRRGLEAV